MGIKGLASTATRLFDQLSDEERREFFTLIDSEATRLARVADQVATVIVLEADDLHVDLDDVVAAHLVADAAENHDRVRVGTEVAATVRADRRLATATLTTLIDNAESYSDGPVTITITELADTVQISVCDEGVGLDQALHPQAFERFTTVRPIGYEGVPGAGLGLYLGRILTEAQGGTLSMEALAEGGTMLVLTLPRGG